MKKSTLIIIIILLVLAVLVLSWGKLTGGIIGECTDSDNGDNPYIGGSVSFADSSVKYKDECFAKGSQGLNVYLKERYCLLTMDNKIYHCSDGCVENKRGEGYCKGEASRTND